MACESAGQWAVAMDMAASLLSDGGRGYEPYRNMEQYSHARQAGSPTDVFKHIILVTLLRRLANDAEAGFVYIDTHAGAGAYDMSSSPQGVWQLIEAERSASENQQGLSVNVATYLEIQQVSSAAVSANSRQRSEGLPYYMGSPLLALSLLRPWDKAILLEDSAKEHEKLQYNVGCLHPQLIEADGAEEIEVIHTDCYQWMSWPFLHRMSVGGDRRGLVFIDPPYDSRSAADTWNLLMIQRIRHHWPASYVVLWYPANNDDRTRVLHRRIQQLNLGKVLAVEASVDAAFKWQANSGERPRANSGVLVIAPPEGFRSEVKDTLASARRLLANSKVASDFGNEGVGTVTFNLFYLSELQ